MKIRRDIYFLSIWEVPSAQVLTEGQWEPDLLFCFHSEVLIPSSASSIYQDFFFGGTLT